MPAKTEAALRQEAQRRGYDKKRADAFVYGTMRRLGWKPRGMLPHPAHKKV
jgi:hypothetical protein